MRNLSKLADSREKKVTMAAVVAILVLGAKMANNKPPSEVKDLLKNEKGKVGKNAILKSCLLVKQREGQCRQSVLEACVPID